ncbi:putative F-box/LRR-repeat protein At4g00320 [Lycium barbarum]|uniref:putative F-box/LRR-repeat protein At4g00320 n=1 Tax=Lycium barbarum TaxID=112863 RepID=UPI00293E28FF|nr:putative F-box/LRR-repeat protein At4g00320 [Lycium barbarum]
MADVLPYCLIHKILSYLTFTEAAQMSILCKTWLEAWLTLPNLEFTVNHLKGNLKIVDNIMKRYSDGKIPIEKFELSDSNYSREAFLLFDKWLDIALQNGVKDLVLRVPPYTSYPLPIFTILAAKSLRQLDLDGCNLMSVSLSSGTTNCHSLRKLSLSFLNLDENMLQTLLNSCPLIISFIFHYCDGLEKIELLNLQKIKSVSVKTFGNQRVKIEAPTLEHLFYFGVEEEYPMLDIIDAPNLVSLEYIGDQIPEIVDANLQWSCHPRRLVLESTSKTIACFMDSLMYMQILSHSTSHGSKPLHNQLQDVKAYIFDWENRRWHPVELESGKMAIRTPSERDTFCFVLD